MLDFEKFLIQYSNIIKKQNEESTLSSVGGNHNVKTNFCNVPKLLLNFLDKQVTEIVTGRYMTLFKSNEGLAYCIGKDFRSRADPQLATHEPRILRMPVRVRQMAMGLDHAVLLSED